MNASELTGLHARLSRFQKDWRIVDSEGPFRVLATGVNSEYVNPNLAASEKAPDYERSILVNLKAVEKRKAPAVKQAFAEHGTLIDEDGNETSNQEEAADLLLDLAYLRGLTLVHEVILHDGEEAPRLPMGGQEITVAVEEAGSLDQNGDPILNVARMQVPEPRKARSFSSLDMDSITSLQGSRKQESTGSSGSSAPIPEVPIEPVSTNGHAVS